MQKRCRDYNIEIGKFPTGKLNKITDVKGVLVGHSSIEKKKKKTGVTVVLPTQDNIFANKMTASKFVINGFGKTSGLMQIEELGTLESPIALTNTLNVGLVQDGLVEYMLKRCEEEKIPLKSINTVVCECNDSNISDISKRAVKQENVTKAIENAVKDFDEGSVGAGRGTICHGLKGGIGSSSRVIELDNEKFTFGVLVQSNYGAMADLMINGKNIGREIAAKIDDDLKVDKGSIIMIVATDVPCSSRQLGRIIKRCSVSLARMGSFIGNGSGEVIIGFTTENRVSHDSASDFIQQKIINENKIDLCFRAVAEACEEAVINSMLASKSDVRLDGRKVYSLTEFADLF